MSDVTLIQLLLFSTIEEDIAVLSKVFIDSQQSNSIGSQLGNLATQGACHGKQKFLEIIEAKGSPSDDRA